MRILQINALLDYASTGRNAFEMSDFFMQNGHESYIAYSKCLKPVKNSYKIGNKIDCKIHGLLSRITGLQGYFSYFSTKKLIRFMKDKQFDIVCLENLHSNYINIPLLLNYLSENHIATVVILYDCFFYTGRCTHYTSDNCFLWKSGCHDCPRLKKDNISWFFDRSKKMYDMKKYYFQKIDKLAVSGVSEWNKKEAEESFLKHAKIIRRIYNWIDMDIFKPIQSSLREKYNLLDKFIIVGVASSWTESKGINKFYELSEKLDDDFVIVLIGKNNNKKETKNIIYVNETHNVEELVEFYNMADVTLNLSLEETFGKVAAESLACGTPVITPNTTANPELIGENCGYVLKKFDVESIVDCLNEVKLKGKDFYSKDSRKFAIKNFNKETNLREYLNLFEELLKG